MLGHHSLSHDDDRFEVDYDNYHVSRSAEHGQAQHEGQRAIWTTGDL